MNLKNWKSIYEYISWDGVLVFWKKNLPGRGLTKFEKHCTRYINTALHTSTLHYIHQHCTTYINTALDISTLHYIHQHFTRYINNEATYSRVAAVVTERRRKMENTLLEDTRWHSELLSVAKLQLCVSRMLSEPVAYRAGGGSLGDSTPPTPPPTKFRRPLKNRAKLNSTVKTVKNCWI